MKSDSFSKSIFSETKHEETSVYIFDLFLSEESLFSLFQGININSYKKNITTNIAKYYFKISLYMYIREYKFNIPLKDNAYKHTHARTHTHIRRIFIFQRINWDTTLHPRRTYYVCSAHNLRVKWKFQKDFFTRWLSWTDYYRFMESLLVLKYRISLPR